MGKDRGEENTYHQSGGGDSVEKVGVEKSKYEQSRKRFMIMFRQNRRYELKIGREYFTFEPYGQREVDEAFLKHPDFIQQKDYFTVKEI